MDNWLLNVEEASITCDSIEETNTIYNTCILNLDNIKTVEEIIYIFNINQFNKLKYTNIDMSSPINQRLFKVI